MGVLNMCDWKQGGLGGRRPPNGHAPEDFTLASTFKRNWSTHEDIIFPRSLFWLFITVELWVSSHRMSGQTFHRDVDLRQILMYQEKSKEKSFELGVFELCVKMLWIFINLWSFQKIKSSSSEHSYYFIALDCKQWKNLLYESIRKYFAIYDKNIKKNK